MEDHALVADEESEGNHGGRGLGVGVSRAGSAVDQQHIMKYTS